MASKIARPAVAMMFAAAFIVAPSTTRAQARPPASPTPPARPAPAQVRPGPLTIWQTRGFLIIGAGGLFGTTTSSETHHEIVNVEQQTWTADYPATTAVEFEGGGAWRIWGNLFAAGTYTYAQSSRAAAVSAEIPHPFFFNQPRSISGDSARLSHSEQAVHISALLNVPLARRLEVDLFGGPSVLRVSRELVKEVEYSEEYPYDTATFSGTSRGEGSKSKLGAHAGVNILWLLSPRIGIGATARYTRTTVDLSTPAGGSVGFDIGGLQAAAGLRIGFLSRPRGRVPPRVTPPPPRRR